MSGFTGDDGDQATGNVSDVPTHTARQPVQRSVTTMSRAQLKPPKPANERTVIPRKPVWLENYKRQHQGQL